MSFGLGVLLLILAALAAVAAARREPAGPIVQRFVEQIAKLMPKMLCALIAAGFIAQLLPQQAIAQFLGPEAGFMALPIAAATGLLVPAGPVISFAIAAVFAQAGASTPALITFITSWSIFAAHRILIYELPLLGPSFFRMRVLAALPVPFLAGTIALIAGLLTSFGAPAPMP